VFFTDYVWDTNSDKLLNFVPLQQFVIQILGLDEFEEKLDKLADGRDDSDWISQLYSKYASVNQDDDWNIPEPPILDTTWGLGKLGSKGNNYLSYTVIAFLLKALQIEMFCL
jgi:hypothetical protein